MQIRYLKTHAGIWKTH